MRMMRALLATISCLALTAGSAFAEQALAPIETHTVTAQTVVDERVFDAVIEAINRSTVSAQTSGRVTEVNFDVDDFVTNGSVLLRMRDTEQRSAVKSAEARSKEARSEFNRTKELLTKKLVAQSAFDRAEAALKAATAELERAREQLEHTVVRAPYDGIVTERHIQVGESANPGQPLMSGLSLEQLRATASIPQNYIATVRQQARARVILPEGISLNASSLTISPYADPQSHTFAIRVDLPEGQYGIYPGMFAKVAFVVGEQQRLLVPREAVVHRSEVTAVYVMHEDGRIAMRHVRLGNPHADGSIEVLAGLTEGEQIALDPIRAGVNLKQSRVGEGS